LSFRAGSELLSGLRSAVARQDLACATASSLDAGGVGELSVGVGDGGVDEDWTRRGGGLRRRRAMWRGGERGCGKRNEGFGSGGTGVLTAILEGGGFKRLNAIGANWTRR
jgi:hypothetical protein